MISKACFGGAQQQVVKNSFVAALEFCHAISNFTRACVSYNSTAKQQHNDFPSRAVVPCNSSKGRLDEAIGVHGSGTIRDIRLHGANAVRVMSRLKKMAKSVVFGYEYVVKCERRLEKKGEMTTLNEILACVKKLVKFHEGLDEKVHYCCLCLTTVCARTCSVPGIILHCWLSRGCLLEFKHVFFLDFDHLLLKSD